MLGERHIKRNVFSSDGHVPTHCFEKLQKYHDWGQLKNIHIQNQHYLLRSNQNEHPPPLIMSNEPGNF